MTSPKESAAARFYKLHYSPTLFKLEILLTALVYATLLIFHQQYDLLPALLMVSLMAFIFFKRYSCRIRFPKHLLIEFRSEPERLICYDNNMESSYSLDQVDVRLTRWFVLLKLERFPAARRLALLQDSFEDIHHYTAFRRFLAKKQE